MNANEFEELIDAQTENDGTMSAICASDVNFVRTMYGLSAVREIVAENAEELLALINGLSAGPYDAYIILLYIPRDALEEVARGVDIGTNFALLGAVESKNFEAVIGCYKKTQGESI